jgi:hypothetical protein
MVVRASSIDADPKHAFAVQQAFFAELLASMPAPLAGRLTGR